MLSSSALSELQFSGLCMHVVLKVVTNVSMEIIDSIFRVQVKIEATIRNVVNHLQNLAAEQPRKPQTKFLPS